VDELGVARESHLLQDVLAVRLDRSYRHVELIDDPAVCVAGTIPASGLQHPRQTSNAQTLPREEQNAHRAPMAHLLSNEAVVSAELPLTPAADEDERSDRQRQTAESARRCGS